MSSLLEMIQREHRALSIASPIDTRDLKVVVTLMLFGLATLGSQAWAADVVTQQIQLTPGWNAVYLEVHPQSTDLETVFDGIPVESAWTWVDRKPTVEFLIDPAELQWNRSGWLGYRSSPAESLLTNLHSIVGNRAYLVKLNGETPVTWSIQGRPSTRRTSWVPDSFNLVGFHLDPSSSVSLGQLTAASPALADQMIYRLDKTSGLWQPVDNPHTVIAQHGESYWIYCEGGSEYQGPWSTDLRPSDGLDFGSATNRQTLKITNHKSTPSLIQVRDLGSSSLGLAYRAFDADRATFDWIGIDTSPTFPVAPGESTTLGLAVRRESFGSDSESTILELSDGSGFRLLIPVRASR